MTADGLMAVFMTHRAALVRFLRARGAGDEAEDIAQDLWLKLTAARPGPIADPIGYLYRMADNLMIDRHRTAARRRRREEGWSTTIGGDAIGEASPAPSAERGLLARERLDDIERRLDALGARTAAIFRRFRLEGIGQRQIATEHGISLSAVEKHLRKAYRALIVIAREDDADSPASERLGIGGSSDVAG